ncbi:MAG: hypothetical protein GXO00_00945 [Candidatus Diapherotrites archaeon]|nr:hypothetical protein [Candidatus Diapherotrites archaeon]
MFRLLRIDLGEESYAVSEIKEAQEWIGGRALGAYLFFREIPPSTEPLSPENPLLLLTGPLTGVKGVPAAGRSVSVTLSPKTGRLTYSVGGKDFGPFLRFAGYDGLFISGRAEEPTILVVSPEGLDFLPAGDLWGADTHEVTRKLKERFGGSVLSIGPAGEKLSPIASMMVDGSSAFGRTGHGAVMGSKNLKAVVVIPGDREPPVKHPEELRSAVVQSLKKLNDCVLVKELRSSGTLGMLVKRIGRGGFLPRAGKDPVPVGVDELLSRWKDLIDPQRSLQEKCWMCPIACKKYIGGRRYRGHGPEYWGGLLSLGVERGVLDPEEVGKLYEKCNRLGLDAISAGYMATRLSEEMKIPVEEALEMLAKNPSLAKEIKEISVRGLENGVCDPRGSAGYALALATNNRGDENQTMLMDEVLLGTLDPKETKGKAAYAYHRQNLFMVADSAVVCIFDTYALDYEDFGKLLHAVTGIEYDLEDFANRAISLERYYNYLRGLEPADGLPPALRGDVPLQELLEEYYKLRKWERGVPTFIRG